jgi:hypothetical protein
MCNIDQLKITCITNKELDMKLAGAAHLRKCEDKWMIMCDSFGYQLVPFLKGNCLDQGLRIIPNNKSEPIPILSGICYTAFKGLSPKPSPKYQ